ncbi:voltage-dependent P/Q-type calcium channel subunit alpha-1A-like [Arapaima gigas]
MSSSIRLARPLKRRRRRRKRKSACIRKPGVASRRIGFRLRDARELNMGLGSQTPGTEHFADPRGSTAPGLPPPALTNKDHPIEEGSMLSPLYADSSVIVQRAQPVRSAQRAQSQTCQSHVCPTTIGGNTICPSTPYYHIVYDVQAEKCRNVPFFGKNGRRPTETAVMDRALYSLVTGNSSAPPIRRRGGLVDHKDVIKAHQSHKMQSTPQARRKEWE